MRYWLMGTILGLALGCANEAPLAEGDECPATTETVGWLMPGCPEGLTCYGNGRDPGVCRMPCGARGAVIDGVPEVDFGPCPEGLECFGGVCL